MRIVLVLAFVLGASIGSGFAFSDADRNAVQSVIARQLDAFLNDDAAAAYSFAAPNITTRFPSQDVFMSMVEQAYKPVHRWRSHEFAALTETPNGLEQLVDIVDQAGKFWTARYTLQRQPDGSWKITGCMLEKKPGTVA